MLSLRISKDLVLQLHPTHETLARSAPWKEAPIQDLGITLIELLDFLAEELLYRQNQIANEACLNTDRRWSTCTKFLKNLHQVLKKVSTLEERLSQLVAEKTDREKKS